MDDASGERRDRPRLAGVRSLDETTIRSTEDLAAFGFVQLHAEVLATTFPGGSLAVLEARPGGPMLTPADRAWCRGLQRALLDAPFASYPLFVATDAGVGVVPPDELVAAA